MYTFSGRLFSFQICKLRFSVQMVLKMKYDETQLHWKTIPVEWSQFLVLENETWC